MNLTITQSVAPHSVSLLLFGGDPTGTNDSTAALVAALATGKPVFVPAGTFRIDGSSIAPPSGAMLFGAGRNSVLYRTTAASAMFWPQASLVDGMTIEDIRFTGPSGNYSDSFCMAFRFSASTVKNLTFSRCIFEKWNLAVSVLKSNPDVTMESCVGLQNAGAIFRSENGIRHRVLNCSSNGSRIGVGDGAKGRVGFWLSDAGDGSDAGYDCTVANCSASTFLNEGVIVRTAYSQVSGCNVSDCHDGADGTYGIVIEPTSGVTNIGLFGLGAGQYCSATENTVRDCDGGIRFSLDPANINSATSQFVIANNIVSGWTGASQKGIAVQISSANNAGFNGVITGNLVMNPAGTVNSDGIYLFQTSNVCVSGNTIVSPRRYGIVLDTSSTGGANQCVNVAISANTIANGQATYGIYLFPRAASSILRCSVVANTISWASGVNGGGIGVEAFSGGATGASECAFNGNHVGGTTTNTGYALRLAGTNMVAAGNTGRCINHRIVENQGAGTLTWMSNGNVADANARKVFFGTAAPSSGSVTGNPGDITWNTAPAVGSPIGWLCTATGNPGTWVALANL